jgi:4-hydroxy-3-methylbut-2-enyl diphosphate reductase
MEIIRAEKMGFCFGVKEAVELARKLAVENPVDKKYMLGMLVHNEQVIETLKKLNMEIISEEEVLKSQGSILKKGDMVIVRAHGTKKEVYDVLYQREATIYDAACIFVKKARKLLLKKENEGKKILFIGDRGHPEVQGIISFAKDVQVFLDFNEFKKESFEKDQEYFLLAQTTLNKNIFESIKKYVFSNYPNIEIGDTICGATYERQKAVEKLAGEVDIMLVVGGKHSSNTKKLLNISTELNPRSYLIQTKDDLDLSWFKGIKKVGITAGASTPEESILEIENSIREEVCNDRY